MNNFPIGIIDSGVGGLSVWKEIQKLLPRESTIYIADSKYAPYGARTESEITQLSNRLIPYLLKRNVKLIIIACNTISVTCLEDMRKKYHFTPIIGTVPAVKLAAEKTESRRIGILSTSATAKSRYLNNLILDNANHHRVITVGTDKLVPFIELGELEAKGLRIILEKELAVFKKEEIDTLVLASTHFPFLEENIKSILGEKVNLIDSGKAIANRVKELLEEKDLLSNFTSSYQELYTTGNLTQFKKSVKALLDPSVFSKIQSIRKVTL